MRQVPPKPFLALVGQGRVGRALAAYLNARQLPYRVITRASLFSEITTQHEQFTAILLAISDTAIENVASSIQQIPKFKTPLVHFSGSLQAEGVYGFHPLYSFTTRAIEAAEFERVPFLVDPGHKVVFRKIFEGLPNPVVELSRRRDDRYHALCVLLGNLPLVIQDACARQLGSEYGVPREACSPYLESLLKNFANALETGPQGLVAGPIARRDQITTQLHLDALKSEAFLGDLYALFVKHSWPGYAATPEEIR